MKNEQVVHSCGCIFCDIGLEPIKMKRQRIHHIPREGRIIICENKKYKLVPMAESADALP